MKESVSAAYFNTCSYVSNHALLSIAEPFNNNLEQRTPAWKLMKAAADSKAKEMNIQQALHEYGQLLRHPYVMMVDPSVIRTT